MSGSVAAEIVIPVVALLALALFIGLVMHADRNPAGQDSGQRSRWTVSGGTFRGADPRQQTPRREAAPPEALAREGQSAGGGRPDS
jgi:hypothetical protein